MKLSIIVPQALHDPRRSVDFLRGWCEQQGVAASDYEVIVAVNSRQADVVEMCRQAVRAHDRVVAAPGENATHYYELGLRASQGQLLLLTEDHVCPTSTCVAELLKFFATSPSRAAFLRSDHINCNQFSCHEAEYYNRQLDETWLQPDCWDRVQLRGWALDRELLHEVGGFPWQYGLFSTRLLAARIHRLGETIDYCEGAVIRHVNVEAPSELQYDVSSYVFGEGRYWDERHDDQETYFGAPAIWRARDARAMTSAFEPIAMLGKAALTQVTRQPSWHGFRTGMRHVRQMVRLLPQCLLGPRTTYWRQRLALATAHLSYFAFKNSKTFGVTSFARLWQAMAEFERANYDIQHPAPARQHQAPPSEPSGNGSSGFDLQARNSSLHECEAWQGRTFRWSNPFAQIPLQLVPGNYTVRIDTGGVRGMACDFPFDLFFNGNHIDPRSIDVREGCIEFPINTSQFRQDRPPCLTLIAAPLSRRRRSGDHRRLGIPLFAVHSECASVRSVEQARRAA